MIKEMKMLAYKMLIVVMVATVVFACTSDDQNPTISVEEFMQKITTTWILESATVDRVDVTDAFEDLTITFSDDKTFVVTNPVSPLWPPTGVFRTPMQSANNFVLERADDVNMVVTAITDVSLVIEITYQTTRNGKTKSVGGLHVYTFRKAS